MGWRERHDITDSGQRDGADNHDREVLWFVDVPAAMAFDPSQQISTGFRTPVAKGEAHPRLNSLTSPELPALFADQFRIVKQTIDSCEVEVTYTREAAAYNTQLAIQRTAHKREAQFRRVETKIPIIEERFGRLIGGGGSDPDKPTYTVDFSTFKETQKISQRLVTLTTMSASIEDQIEAQDGGIHLWGGRPALFEAGDIVQHGPGVWKCLFTWYRDKGTRGGKMATIGEANIGGTLNEPSMMPNPIVYGPAPGTGQPDTRVKQYRPPEVVNMLTAQIGFSDIDPSTQLPRKYIRSPFHEVHYILGNDLPPKFVQFFPFRIESNPPNTNNGLGWQLLPGGPQP